MPNAMRFMGLGLLIGIAGCTPSPVLVSTSDIADARARATRHMQLGPAVDIPFSSGYVRRFRQVRIEQANAEYGLTSRLHRPV